MALVLSGFLDTLDGSLARHLNKTSSICVTTFLVVGIFTKNDSQKSFFYSPGLIERAEAFIVFSLMILLPFTFSVLAWGFIALTFLTAFLRLWQFIKAPVG
jgi:archaetidylinositol phosphate synthase